jgi:predicted phage terminase large subunit-like protein
MRAASNPGGAGHAWVFERFLVAGRPNGRIFVPARLADNPHLDAAEYRESLSELDPITQRQLLDGVWVTDASNRPYDAAWWRGAHRFDPDDGAEITRRWLTLDTAFKDAEANDYTACGLWEMEPTRYRARYRPLWQRRLQFPALVAAVAETAERYKSTLVEVVIEDRASGTSAIQVLRGATDGWLSRRIADFTPKESKTERARNGTIWCARGYVLLPAPSAAVPELQAFEDQLYRFPDVEHDDYVDTFSMGILWLRDWFDRDYRSQGVKRGVAE